MTHFKENEINDLLIRFFENDINDEQREKLLAWAQSDPNASKVYWDFAKDIAIIRTQIAGQIRIEDGASGDQGFDQAFWATMADYEKTAPEIEIPKEKPSRELIPKVVYPPKEKQKVGKFHLDLFLHEPQLLYCLWCCFSGLRLQKSGSKLQH